MRYSNKDELVAVGRVAGLHGVRGEVRVLLFGGVDEFPWKTLIPGPAPGAEGRAGADETAGAGGVEEKGGLPETLAVIGVRRHKGMFLVFFKGFETREAAAALHGRELFVKKEDLPELPSDEIYQHDLIGVKVKTDDGRDLGAVTGIVPTGAVDVLEIRGPLGEVLVPMAGDFIVSMDLERNEMVVRLIEGLLPEEK